MQTEKIAVQQAQIMSHHGFLKIRSQFSRETVEIGLGVTIGRESACSFQIDDDCISGRHCRIERRGNSFIIRDLRSRNGSFLNGTKVLEAELHDKDVVRLGKTELIFTLDREQIESQLFLHSKNPLWNIQLSRLPSIAQCGLPVLLLGSSGTGKEILAQQIHRQSPRRLAPFISVNCSALGESLVESELFGHLRGSFTGATSDRKGAFESARGGTLFLDEIGDLPLSLQPKLLRALENNEIRPVGSDRVVKTDVRIVAATHADLKTKMVQGAFRSDLYYRLYGIQLSPPDLKDRIEDFEDLLYHFAKRFRVRFSHSAIRILKDHKWPGNIRELKNLVARSQALFPSLEIQSEHILELLEEDKPSIEAYKPEQHREGSLMKELERRLILERLTANKGNQRKTANELGLPKSTLHDRIRTYGINTRSFKA